jgi:hypothetical protein
MLAEILLELLKAKKEEKKRINYCISKLSLAAVNLLLQDFPTLVSNIFHCKWR